MSATPAPGAASLDPPSPGVGARPPPSPFSQTFDVSLPRSAVVDVRGGRASILRRRTVAAGVAWAVDSDATLKLITGAVREMSRDPKVGRSEAMRRSMLAPDRRGLKGRGTPTRRSGGPCSWSWVRALRGGKGDQTGLCTAALRFSQLPFRGHVRPRQGQQRYRPSGVTQPVTWVVPDGM
jgi:hypothetical protein